MKYEVPTLVVVVDVESTEDYPGRSHYECKLCGEHIEPGRCADSHEQYIRGLGGQMLEATSISRPDISWRYVDKQGHEHRWFSNGEPATVYRP